MFSYHYFLGVADGWNYWVMNFQGVKSPMKTSMHGGGASCSDVLGWFWFVKLRSRPRPSHQLT